MRRLAALACVLLVLAAACGRDDPSDADRVIASPVTSPAATGSPKATATAPATAQPSGKTDAPSTTAPQPARAANLAAARVKLTKLADIDDAVAFATRKGDDAFYIAGRHNGEIRPLRGRTVGSPVVDVGGEISTGNEQGLLGIVFSPDGDKLYINFTNRLGDTVVREYDFAGGRASSPRTVLTVDQPYVNHNGGNLVFGPDGYLYIGLGDGGSGGDPHNNGQNLDTLLGKMLRIDPDASGSRAYTSPSSNPFVGRAGRDEIWSYGLRNPWRYSFDRATKDLWIGDVGQNAWEEVDYERAGDGGENYGWRVMEGTHSRAGGTPPANHHPPIYEYSIADDNCAITGGYVYRGSQIPDLYGAYVFADFCVGSLRAFVRDGTRASGHRFLGAKLGSLSSFGQDKSGELYVLSLGGGVYRIDPA